MEMREEGRRKTKDGGQRAEIRGTLVDFSAFSVSLW